MGQCLVGLGVDGRGGLVEHQKPGIGKLRPGKSHELPLSNREVFAALTDLGHLLADLRYLEAASGILRWAAPFAERYPAGHCSMLTLASRHRESQQQIILHGPESSEWIAAARAGYAPNRRVFSITFDESLKTLPAYLPRMVSADTRERVTAYVCSGMSCSAPINELSELRTFL